MENSQFAVGFFIHMWIRTLHPPPGRRSSFPDLSARIQLDQQLVLLWCFLSLYMVVFSLQAKILGIVEIYLTDLSGQLSQICPHHEQDAEFWQHGDRFHHMYILCLQMGFHEDSNYESHIANQPTASLSAEKYQKYNRGSQQCLPYSPFLHRF